MTSIFTIAANLTFENLAPAMAAQWRLEWISTLENEESEIKWLPAQPCCEELGIYESTLVKFVKTSIVLGTWAAERLNHNPWTPHLPATVRPGASVFKAATPEEILRFIDPEKAVVTAVSGGPGVRIFNLHAGGFIGTNREAAIIADALYEMVEEHGTLMPRGPVEEKEYPTDKLTAVFTWEGPEHGWVAASLHPGVHDPTPNLEGLSVGQIVKGSDLLSKGFGRALPGLVNP